MERAEVLVRVALCRLSQVGAPRTTRNNINKRHTPLVNGLISPHVCFLQPNKKYTEL